MSVRRLRRSRSTTEQLALSTEQPASLAVPHTVWLAIIMLAAALAASGAGLLTYAGGANLPTAVLAGGGAYAGSVLFMIAIKSFVDAVR